MGDNIHITYAFNNEIAFFFLKMSNTPSIEDSIMQPIILFFIFFSFLTLNEFMLSYLESLRGYVETD